MSFERLIAFRYLAGKRDYRFISIVTWISILGISVGVAALIAVLAVMTGAQEDIKSKLLGSNAHILIGSYFSDGIEGYDKIIPKIKSVDHVVSVFPYIYSQAILVSPIRSYGAIIRGVSISDTSIKKFVKEGSVSDLSYSKAILSSDENAFEEKVTVRRFGIALGSDLADKLSVRIGDRLNLILPSFTSGSLLDAKPLEGNFYLASIFKTGLYEYDSAFAIVDLDVAQKLLDMKGKITGFEVMVDNIYESPSIADKIYKVLGTSFIVQDWQSLNRNLIFALNLEKRVIGIILALIIAVAAFNIASSLIMVVISKRADIAILRSMGATKRSIMKIFITQGVVIGTVGIFIGLFLGLGICEILKRYTIIELPSDIYSLERLPVQVEALDVFTILIVAFILTISATIYPAYTASRQVISESLRHD